MAIDKQMPELSLRAMHDAVRGGPPVPVANDNRRVRGGMLTTAIIISTGAQYYVEGGNENARRRRSSIAYLDEQAPGPTCPADSDL